MIIGDGFPNPAQLDLPLFQVSGGTEQERGQWSKQLLAGLQRRSLCGTFIKGEEYRHRDWYALLCLVKQYDLVIIDTGIDAPQQQVCIEGYGKIGRDSLAWTGDDDKAILQLTDRLVLIMDDLVRQTPVWACILIGGKSSRMGRAKHLIQNAQKRTWLEQTIEILSPLVDGVVVSGAGRLPDKLADTTRLADIPEISGPLTGIIAACRWQPMVSWLLVACDMPHITTEALQWLLSDRHAGCWGRVPRLVERKRAEPLFAWYDFRAGQIFEEQFYEKNLRIGDAAGHPKIDNPMIPESLRQSWQNINTPEQLPTEPEQRGD